MNLVPRHDVFLRLLLAVVAFLLASCASLGVPEADTMAKKIGSGYVTLAAVADSAKTLKASGKLTAAESARVEASLTTAKDSLQAAEVFAKTNPNEAQTRLTAAITTLTALRAFLATKQGAPA